MRKVERALDKFKGEEVTLQQLGDILTNLQKCTNILKDLEQVPDEPEKHPEAESASVDDLVGAATGSDIVENTSKFTHVYLMPDHETTVVTPPGKSISKSTYPRAAAHLEGWLENPLPVIDGEK